MNTLDNDEARALRERAEKAEDKALRFDLDRAGIEAREREAVELVELRAEVTRLRARAEKAEANYAFMVERAANQHLDGYRELGARAAAAENEADRLRGEAKVANALHRELNDLFGWGDESMLHALAHVRNAVLNLRADLRTERFLRENADKLAASQVKEGAHEAVVAYLRAQAEIAYDNSDAHHALWCAAEAIERGEHHKEGG